MSNDTFYKVYNKKISRELVEKDKHFDSNPIRDYTKFYSIRTLYPFHLDEIDQLSNNEDYTSNEFSPISELVVKFNFIEQEIQFTKNDIIQLQSKDNSYQLIEWIKKLVFTHHGSKLDIALCQGSQHGLDCIFRSIFDRNDSVIIESYTYNGLFNISNPQGVNCIEIESDEHGLSPKHLEKVLKNWKLIHRDKYFPKAIYFVPNGSNPTGQIINITRKKELYKLASRFNLLIIEDDPFYYLQIDQQEFGKSFLEMDNDNRVIRIDTFSKLLSNSFKIGYITTCTALLEPIKNEITNSIINPSVLPQLFLFKYFSNLCIDNDMVGFNLHVEHCRNILFEKRQFTNSLFKKHLQGIIEYTIPKAGIFFWVKLIGITCSNTFIRKYIHQKHNIVFGIGKNFSINPNLKSSYIRINFIQDSTILENSLIILSNELKKVNNVI